MARVDIAILREIVHVIGARAEVPEFVDVSKKRFHVTYLEDHRQRIEEALRRNDRDRLNMLYGQLESKVKYQLVRGGGAGKEAASASAPAGKKVAKQPAVATPPAAAKKATAKKTAAKTPKTAPKKVAAAPRTGAKKVPSRSASKKKK